MDGDSFYEVTFLARTRQDADWQAIGTDDSAPYRVLHDVADLNPGENSAICGAFLYGPYWFSPAQRAGSVASCVGIASVTTSHASAWRRNS